MEVHLENWELFQGFLAEAIFFFPSHLSCLSADSCVQELGLWLGRSIRPVVVSLPRPLYNLEYQNIWRKGCQVRAISDSLRVPGKLTVQLETI